MHSYPPFWKRVLAHNVDLVIILPILYLLSSFVAENILLYPLAMIVYITYYTGFEVSAWRATPGKRFVKIEVSTTEPESAKLFLRNVFKILSALPLFLGFTYAAFDKRRRTLHDILSKCTVVEAL